MLAERVTAAYEAALEKTANVATPAAAAGESLAAGARKVLKGWGSQVSATGTSMKNGLRQVPMGKATAGQTAQHWAGKGLQAYGHALQKNPLTTAGVTAAGVGTAGYMASR